MIMTKTLQAIPDLIEIREGLTNTNYITPRSLTFQRKGSLYELPQPQLGL